MIILALSGTGRIGTALQVAASQRNHTLVAVSNQRYPSLAPGCHHVFCDLNNPVDWTALAGRLKERYRKIDVIVDIVPNANTHSNSLIAQFRRAKLSPHIITISSTFVYDRALANSTFIDEVNQTVATGRYGGYVDNKLRIEQLWQCSEYPSWTLLRPHHVLGTGYHLGCTPPHNRDRQLLEILKRSPSISLAAAGRRHTSFVHVADVAECILTLAKNPRTYGQIYNLVHPGPIAVKDYYLEIASILGVKPVVREYPEQRIIDHHPFWALTSYDQVYAVDKLNKHIGYCAKHSFSKCISDSLKSYRPEEQRMLSAINSRLTNSSYIPRISIADAVRT